MITKLPIYRIGKLASLYQAEHRKEEIERVIGDGKPSVLVGNKIDLADQGNREVGQTDGEALKEELNAFEYYETSAKEGLLVSPVFKEITLEILRRSNKI